MGEYEIVDENIYNKDDEQCRYYNSITERQCKRSKDKLCEECQFKDPKTDCVKKRTGQELCSDDYQVN